MTSETQSMNVPNAAKQDAEPKIFTAEPVWENSQRDKQRSQYPA